jgi:hypothetical protein
MKKFSISFAKKWLVDEKCNGPKLKPKKGKKDDENRSSVSFHNSFSCHKFRKNFSSM